MAKESSETGSDGGGKGRVGGKNKDREDENDREDKRY